MDNDKLIKKMRETLSQHQMPVDDALWQRIEARLHKAPIVWYRRPVVVAASVAAVLLVVSLILFVHPSRKAPVAPHTSDVVAAQENTPEELQLIEQPSCAMVCKQENVSCSLPNIGEKAYSVERDTESIHCQQASVASDELVVVEDNEALACRSSVVTDSTKEQPCNKVVSVEKDAVKPDMVTGEAGSTDLLAQSNNQPYYEYDESPMDIYPDLVAEVADNITPSMWLAFEASTSGAAYENIPFTFRGHSGEFEFRHHMPLNVKVLFEKRFGKWGIGTGVSYTYLVSDYDMTCNLRVGRQDMHYVGVPLYASFEFARVKRFSFYLSAGGQVDFNTAGAHIESAESHLHDHIERYDFRVEKPQFSAQVHLGASFELVKHLDLFIEPTLGYYFNNGSCVHTVWHENPLSFYITFGLRTGF